MKIRILEILLFFIVVSVSAQEKDSCCYQQIRSEDFYLLSQEKQVLIIDVRSEKVFKQERIEKAQLAETKESLKKLLENEHQHTTILIYCKEGKRSKTASEIICRDLMFTSVYSLEGGILQWKKEGYPVIRN